MDAIESDPGRGFAAAPRRFFERLAEPGDSEYTPSGSDQLPLLHRGPGVKHSHPGGVEGGNLDRPPGIRAFRISGARHDGDESMPGSGLRAPAGERVAVRDPQHGLEQVRTREREYGLRLRISHPTVELDDARPRGGQHEPGVEEAAIGGAGLRHRIEYGLRDLAPHFVDEVRIRRRRGGVRPHAAGVQAAVAFPDPLVVPGREQRDGAFAADLEEVVSRGCSLLLNSARWDRSAPEERAFNAAWLLTPGSGRARRQTYDKMHLVPFGEYVPFGRVLPAVRQLARQAGGFSPGDEVRLLEADGARLGVSICFEIVFPEQVAARVRRGANLLVTITNDSWYGRTWAPHQHLRPARFRAAENGRPLVRAAITGISAVIDRRGRVLADSPIDEAMVMRAQVVPLGGMTPFARAPLLVPLLCVALAGFAILRRRLRLTRTARSTI